jgi:hypothetical protein
VGSINMKMVVQARSDISVQKITKASQALVAHAYNPSYSGGRDQEVRGSKSK